RCDTSPGQPFGANLTRVFPVSPGGATLTSGYANALNPSAVLNGRLVVRRGGSTVDAGMKAEPDAASLVKADPPFPFTAELSRDGHNVFVAPTGFLKRSTSYKLSLAGNDGAGGFSDAIRFKTAPLGPQRLSVGAGKVTALSMSRLAIPLPPFLTSVNQI